MKYIKLTLNIVTSALLIATLVFLVRVIDIGLTAEEFSDKLRWWLAHDEQRFDAIRAAKAAISGRTFVNNAKSLLGRVDNLN